MVLETATRISVGYAASLSASAKTPRVGYAVSLWRVRKDRRVRRRGGGASGRRRRPALKYIKQNRIADKDFMYCCVHASENRLFDLAKQAECRRTTPHAKPPKAAS